ncbi:MAG: hypothetical protein IPP85_05975 [Propionivibrio sp.]|nr:hypothetical protein [Propionivibrio sp.]
MRLQGEVKLDEALWLPGSLCGLFRIPSTGSPSLAVLRPTAISDSCQL